jgi:hypothetical protein
MDIDNKKIKVGYTTIDIKLQAPQFTKNNMTTNYAQYTSRENLIEIQPMLDDVDEANALIHEILHGIVWVSSLSQDGQPLEDENEEEVVVNSITNNLIQVFRDNGWLLDYLKQKVK